MKELHNENNGPDIIREWANMSHDVTAPEGFTVNVMNRIAIEPALAGRGVKGVIGQPFILVAATFFTLMIVMSFLSPSVDTGLIGTINRIFPDINALLSGLSLPDLTWSPAYNSLLYITIGISMLLLFDAVIQRFLQGKKK